MQFSRRGGKAPAAGRIKMRLKKYRPTNILICIVLVITFIISGCSDEKETEITQSSDPIEQEMENIEYFSDMLKSWEIFTKEVSNSDGDPERDPFATAARDAIAGEATYKKTEICVLCPQDHADDYKRMAGEFKWQFADDERYSIDITIITDENSRQMADVFIYDDSSLEKLVSEGKVVKVNDKLRNYSMSSDTAESIRSCTFREKQYGFPMSSCKSKVLVYDKRVFSEDETENIDTIIKTASLKQKSLYYNIGDPVTSAGIFLAAGCEPIFDGKNQVIGYDNENGVNAVKALCRLSSYQGKGLICSGGIDRIQTGFADGSICAAVIDGSDTVNVKKAIGDENTGIAPLPSVEIAGEMKKIHSFYGYDVLGVDPRSKYPFTAQLFAYYISRPRSQIGMYYSVGSIPSVDVSEYYAITADPLYSAVEAQKEQMHVRYSVISNSFISRINKSMMLTEIVESKGNISDDRIQTFMKSVSDKNN